MNYFHLKQLFNDFPIDELIENGLMDIGAAYGDLIFMLTSLAFGGTIVEKQETNLMVCWELDVLTIISNCQHAFKSLMERVCVISCQVMRNVR